MPICTILLISLRVSVDRFLTLLYKPSHSPRQRPIVVSRVLRWIIKPGKVQILDLLSKDDGDWDLLVIYADDNGLPSEVLSPEVIKNLYTLKTGVPSSMLSNFRERNESLLLSQDPARDMPDLKETLQGSGDELKLTEDLKSWISTYDPAHNKGAMSMLNFLAFHHGKEGDYINYGKEFSTNVGKKYGGAVKIAGKVTDGKGWDQIAFAHYPSIRHFASMIGSKAYQEINEKYRLGSLKDTGLLCTSELAVPWPHPQVIGAEHDLKGAAKL